MNRHHYSLYVHNCRLVFLLRRDFTQVDTFRPAEFHWKLEQVRASRTHSFFPPRAEGLSGLPPPRFAVIGVEMRRQLHDVPDRFEFPS